MNTSTRMSVIVGIVCFLDIVLLNIGHILAYLFRFGFTPPMVNIEPYRNLAPWLVVAGIIVLYLFNMYSEWEFKSIGFVVQSSALVVLTYTIIVASLAFWHRGFSFPRTIIILGAIIQFILIVSFRVGLILIFRQFSHVHKNILVIGTSLDGDRLILNKLIEHVQRWFHVVSYKTESEVINLKEILSTVNVVLITPDVQNKLDIVQQCITQEVKVMVIPELFELMMFGADYQQIDDMMVLSLKRPSLSLEQKIIKRLFDLVVSVILLLTFSPVILILFVVIPITSSGPAIFQQERLGLSERIFKIIKFRSMVDNAEIRTGPILASECDPRITPIGRFIRATRLDELPQLINVLKGEMSIVGPRPERSFFVRQFKSVKPYYNLRMSVKPGITGLAQVMAKYNTSMEDKLRFDLHYINNYSLFMDIKILFKTIKVVLTPDKACGINRGVNFEEKQKYEEKQTAMMASREFIIDINIEGGKK